MCAPKLHPTLFAHHVIEGQVSVRGLYVVRYLRNSGLTLNFLFFAGWSMGTRNDRGDVQSDCRDLAPELQAPVYDLDIGQG